LKVAVLIRLRTSRREPQAFTAPLNLRLAGREIPAGLIGLGLVVSISALAMLMSADIPSIAAASLMLGLGLVMAFGRKGAESSLAEEEGPFAPLPSSDVSVGQVEARPGNILVCIRHPHSLAHVSAALRDAGNRDVVIVSVRLLGIDVDDETGGDTALTRDERFLFAAVIAATERQGHAVRFLIVPAHNVVDAIMAVAIQLVSSEVHVGESGTLPASEQARLLGEAWERSEKPQNLQVRLVIHHDSGRTDSYHLGAHSPSLTPDDLDLIHRVWLDAVKAIGPQVHHHDVVRAALTQMENKLSGPDREEALAVIRNTARPADELAAAVHDRDYSRLRDLVRNRHASDIERL
jgi:hypothetical protein